MTNLDQPGTHRSISRGSASVPESSLPVGRFGRMFRNLPSYEPEEAFLREVADQMVEGEAVDSETLPAGLTYFGQFVDHDLTFDPVSSLARQNDPDALTSFRTPVFDLDCVYGRGRDDQPYMYDGDKMLIGVAEGGNEKDLPRNGKPGRALIGDPRNDENIIVSQLQLAFLLLHNRLIDDLQPGGALEQHRWSSGSTFQEAQRLARWHYQWLVLEWFLPKICDQEVLGQLVRKEPVDGGTCRSIKPRRFYDPQVRPYIPVEWSVAAYRFGHSLIRQKYHLNPTLRGFRNGEPLDIFLKDPPEADRLQHLDGRRPLPPFWTICWRMFFDFGGDQADLQMARKIDTKLAKGLEFLPGTEDPARALAFRNLQRGATMGLPSGEAVARRLCVKPLSRQQLGLQQEAPLWYYILREAEIFGDGEKLGRVGSTIVAETMLGLLAADPFSFLRTEPTWEPVIPQTTGGEWDVADLLAYAVPDDGCTLQPPGETPPPPEGARSW